MSIPSKSNSVWTKLLTGSLEIKFAAMVLNLLVFNLKNRVAKEPDSLDDAITEMINYIEANQNIPRIAQAVEQLDQAK